ncbi:MAG: M23 family metallopeptidase [Deltaproteobacteria bacterium]|nr:M23 family metallopeptidase [Deltaproteobacteria bacterium]
MRWPVEGEVVRHFGKGASGENLGIDIGAPAGTAVRAAAGGRVIYARAPTQAYGPLVIVDHGGRLHTVYASLKELSVKRGDSVEQGHTIGTVGESTLTPPPHLHFEVRRNGDAVDPLSFLPAR